MQRTLHARRKRYALLGAGLISVLWVLVAAYLMMPPAYTSRWEIVLPHNGSDANLRLDDVGQATLSSKSPFGMPGINPTESYKQILASREVLVRAAEHLQTDTRALTAPRVSTVLQTSVMRLAVKGDSPETARQQAFAFHDAFLAVLDGLRKDEIARRERSIETQIQTFKEKVDEAEQRVLDHRAGAHLISTDQFDRSSNALSDLEDARLQNAADIAAVAAEVVTLARQLGISPTLANDAFDLQSDATFQRLLATFAEVSADLPVLETQWGAKHPRVQDARRRFASLSDAVQARSVAVVGHRDFNTLQLITLADSDERGALFAALLEKTARLAGLEAKRDKLSLDIQWLDKALRMDLRERSTLEALEREHQMAEAIFVSALTRLDTHKADVFAVYPMVQLLSSPSLPASPSSPLPVIGIGAALAGTLAVLACLFVLWNRTAWIQSILKSD